MIYKYCLLSFLSLTVVTCVFTYNSIPIVVFRSGSCSGELSWAEAEPVLCGPAMTQGVLAPMAADPSSQLSARCLTPCLI